VDYALFIVTRHRRNLRRGMNVRDSIVAAINTSGRAVLFAGTTVCIAMLGLTALGVSFFYGMAVGTAIAVSLTMLAALTLLPALLSFLGLRVLRRKERRAVLAGNFVDIETVGFWARWSELVARRRVAFGVVGAVIVVALAIPFLALRLGHADQGNDPAGTTTRKGYDLIAQGFGPGYNSTLTLVVDGPQAQATAETVGTALARVPNVDTRSIFVPTQGSASSCHWCRSSRSARHRMRRPRSWSTSCATTCCHRFTTEPAITSTCSG
jgi:RND superfamily putative drug exporter